MLHTYHCLTVPATKPAAFYEDTDENLDEIFAKKMKKLCAQLKTIKMTSPEHSINVDWMIDKLASAVKTGRELHAELAFTDCYILVEYVPKEGFLLIIKRLPDGTVSVRSYQKA